MNCTTSAYGRAKDRHSLQKVGEPLACGHREVGDDVVLLKGTAGEAARRWSGGTFRSWAHDCRRDSGLAACVITHEANGGTKALGAEEIADSAWILVQNFFFANRSKERKEGKGRKRQKER